MKHSVGVINPSLFEGWSTTVEETKSLGLNMVLSDIPVHREQNPDRGVFFDPRKPASLADALAMVLERYATEVEHTYQAHAKERVRELFSLFGSNYQAITLETLAVVVAASIRSRKDPSHKQLEMQKVVTDSKI